MMRLASIARTVITEACLVLLPDDKIAVDIGTTRLVVVDWDNQVLERLVVHYKLDALCLAIRSAIGDKDAGLSVAEIGNEHGSEPAAPDLDEDSPGF